MKLRIYGAYRLNYTLFSLLNDSYIFTDVIGRYHYLIGLVNSRYAKAPIIARGSKPIPQEGIM